MNTRHTLINTIGFMLVTVGVFLKLNKIGVGVIVEAGGLCFLAVGAFFTIRRFITRQKTSAK